MNPAILISSTGRISAVINGLPLVIETDHPNYSSILDAIRSKDYDLIPDLADVAAAVSQFVSDSGKVFVQNGQVFYGATPVHNTVADRILSFISNDLPFQPILNFLENLMQNPSMRAVNELYGFLEHGNLPLTEDGHFLAYKKVRSNYKDIYTGTFDNSVGAVCEMQRNQVDEDKDRTCSYGLHFCSQEYLPYFGGSTENGFCVMIVKINPKDVVSIPSDYNNAKGRACRYEVVGELEKEQWLDNLKVYADYDAIDYDSDEDDEDDDNDYYAYKASGHKFYNNRDNSGKFVKKI